MENKTTLKETLKASREKWLNEHAVSGDGFARENAEAEQYRKSQNELPANAYKMINDDGSESWVHFSPIIPGHIQEFVRAEIAASRPYKPLLVVQIKEHLNAEQAARFQSNLEFKMIEHGWRTLIFDRCDVAEVRAFGVTESEFETFAELKKLLEDQIKQNGK